VRFAEAFETFWRAYRARISFWLIAFAALAIVGIRLTPFDVQLSLWWGLTSILALTSVCAATMRLFLIRLKERRTYFIVPKRCLPAQLEPQLFDLFLQHLAILSA
jgi:hypothetical protein